MEVTKMWNGGYNPQLENIAGIREVDAYLRDRTFRRGFRGYHSEDVQECLAEVSKRYKMIIASLLSLQGQGKDALIQDLQASLDRVTAESEALYDWNRRFQQTSSTLLAENDRLQQENAALRAALAQSGYYY